MSSPTSRVTQPDNGEGRPGTGRPSDFVNNDSLEYTLNSYRVQRLMSTAGLSSAFAEVSAPFVFGGAA
jgi:hypothetical protein